MQQSAQRRWQVADIEISGSVPTLTVGGQAVDPGPEPLRALLHLLENQGRLVTRDALIRAIWPGQIVSDAALSRCVDKLREAIGDGERGLVRAHHRYGYRLDAPVVTIGPVPIADAVAANSPLEPAPAADPAPSTENRPLTVLFCDLVGSTELAETLSPEAFRQLLVDYGRTATAICERHAAHVAQQMGDGLLIYFGYPVAYDDDAERALRCACELVAALTQSGRDARIEVRIGLHSATLLIGAIGREVLATGVGVHLAARLQTLAEPGTILASDATLRLAPGLFVTRDLGQQSLRGIAGTVRVHQVLQPSGMRSALEAAAALTPFVGRDAELDLLLEAWRAAFDGRGSGLLLSGEPGLGKSRLIIELRGRLPVGSYLWLEGRADRLGRQAPFRPLTELLARRLALRETDSDECKREVLERALESAGITPADALPLLAPLFDLPMAMAGDAAQLGPELRRRRTLALLAQLIIQIAQDQPTILFVEDLHWADDSTLEVLGLLLEQIAQQPLLLLLTARPEFVPLWPAERPLVLHTLAPLPQAEIERMLAALAPELETSSRDRILERSDGTPLFVEELARAWQDSARHEPTKPGGNKARTNIPGGLHGLLMARLDRLGPARELAQTLAVLGAEAPYPLIRAMARQPEPALNAQLVRLVESGLFHVQGSGVDTIYRFRHALIRDVANDSMLSDRRVREHAHAARAIENVYAGHLAERYGELVHHCEAGGLPEAAADYAKLAGERALLLGANPQAITHFQTAVRLLEALPASAEQRLKLAALHTSLGSTLAATHGYADGTMRAQYARAHELCVGLDGDETMAPILMGLAAYELVRGNHAAALQLAAQLSAAVEASGDAQARAATAFFRGQAHLFTAQLEAAAQDFASAVACYDAGDCRDMGFRYQEDAKSGSLALQGWIHALRGQPQQALEHAQRSMAHALELRHLFSRAVACAVNGHGAVLRRDAVAARQLSEAGLALCREQGITWYDGWMQMHLGWADLQDGRAADGLARIRAGLEGFRFEGAEFFNPWALSLLSEALAANGQLDEARTALDEALQIAERNGERLHLAELQRLSGELLLRTPGADPADAERAFEQAIATANAQGARGWLLRATVSLARRLALRGLASEAEARLRPILAGYPEGLETPDLREALTLLASLR